MTRLVLHAGTHLTRWPAIQAQLVAARQALAEAKIVIPEQNTPGVWHEMARQLTHGDPSSTLASWCRKGIEAGADILVLSSHAAEDALANRVAIGHLVEFGRELDLDLEVVVVVRDQLGYLNRVYSQRVMSLTTSTAFEAFAKHPTPVTRFDYMRAFGRVIDADNITLRAVPYSSVDPKTPAAAVLEAIGVSSAVTKLVPPTSISEGPLPGPVLLAATRLLHKRLTRHRMLDEQPEKCQSAVRELKRHASSARWDDGRFWGWTDELAAATTARFAASNDRFARLAWGKDWPEPAGSGRYRDVDLASEDPALSVDVINTVDALVKEFIQFGLPTVAAESADEESAAADEAEDG